MGELRGSGDELTRRGKVYCQLCLTSFIWFISLTPVIRRAINYSSYLQEHIDNRYFIPHSRTTLGQFRFRQHNMEIIKQWRNSTKSEKTCILDIRIFNNRSWQMTDRHPLLSSITSEALSIWVIAVMVSLHITRITNSKYLSFKPFYCYLNLFTFVFFFHELFLF